MSEGNYCRVCGLFQDELPWGEDGHSPTFSFCPCCGVEFWYQDWLPSAARKYRTSWIEGGANWKDQKMKPTTWDRDKQMAHIPATFK